MVVESILVDLRLEYADVRQPPELLSVIQAVADHKFIADGESDVFDLDIALVCLGLVEQGTDRQASGSAIPQDPSQIIQGQTSVSNIFDDQDVASFDADIQILLDLDHTSGLGGVTIAGNGHKVDLSSCAELADQVRAEDEGTFEDADKHQGFLEIGIISRNILGQTGHSLLQSFLVNQHPINGLRRIEQIDSLSLKERLMLGYKLGQLSANVKLDK